MSSGWPTAMGTPAYDQNCGIKNSADTIRPVAESSTTVTSRSARNVGWGDSKRSRVQSASVDAAMSASACIVALKSATSLPSP